MKIQHKEDGILLPTFVRKPPYNVSLSQRLRIILEIHTENILTGIFWVLIN